MNTQENLCASPSMAEIVAKLRTIQDPEIGLNVVDLGMIYGIEVHGDVVAISMTLTNPGCPLQEFIEQGIGSALCSIPGIRECAIRIVWNPSWNPSMISDEGKRFLGHVT